MLLDDAFIYNIPRYRRGRLGRGSQKSHIDSCVRRGASTAALRLGLLLLVGGVGGGEGWVATGGTGGKIAAGRGSCAMALQSTSRVLWLGERGAYCCGMVFSAVYVAILP